MTKTAAETVAHFRSFNTHYWGPTTSQYRNEYNGKWYANPHTVAVGRATADGTGEYYCADAVTAMLLWAGIDIRPGCPGFCNCGSLYNYMWGQPASGLYGFKTVSLDDAQAGDITLLHFGGVWGHVLMHRAANSGGNMLTVEGDTSNSRWPGSSTTGGVQCDRTRSLATWRGNTHTFRPTGYAPPVPPVSRDSSRDLTVDGYCGRATITRLQQVLGTPADGVISPGGSTVIKALQTFLNAHGGLDERGHKLVVDGLCDLDNTSHATVKQHTIAGLQRYLHTTNDGVFDSPSSGVRAFQRALNQAAIGSRKF